MAPIVTMRLFALEKFSGTFETLMTAPVRETEVVLAKFSAAMAFYCVIWLPLLAWRASDERAGRAVLVLGSFARGAPTVRTFGYEAPPDAGRVLGDLVEVYRQGSCEPVPLFPENLGGGGDQTEVLLCNPKNIHVGIWRQIRFESDRDISEGTLKIVATLRFDVKYAEESGVARAINVQL